MNDEENMVCINELCDYNIDLYVGHCTKGENEPEIYDCDDAVICFEGHPIIDKISQIKEEAGEQRPTTERLPFPCNECYLGEGCPFDKIKNVGCWRFKTATVS